MSTFLLGILLALLALIGPNIYKMVIKPALFDKPIFNHAPGPCQHVRGIEHGAEDMEVLPSGHVIMSTGLRTFVDDTKPPYSTVKGSIKLLDLNGPETGAKDLPVEEFDTPSSLFNPHGISMWHDSESGRAFLFVVNHKTGTAKEETVEKFEFDQSKLVLKHVTTYRSSEFSSLNDIKATGPDTFYFTNSLYFSNLILMLVEVYAGLPLASFGYFDGLVARKLYWGLYMANGINLSPDGRFLYVGQLMSESLTVYQRHSDNNVTFFKNYYLDCSVDNIEVEGEYLWLTCHADFPKMTKHAEDQRIHSPSRVFRLRMVR